MRRVFAYINCIRYEPNDSTKYLHLVETVIETICQKFIHVHSYNAQRSNVEYENEAVRNEKRQAKEIG